MYRACLRMVLRCLPLLSIRRTSAWPRRSATPLHLVPSASSTECVLAWNSSSNLLNLARSVMICEVAPQSTIRSLMLTPALARCPFRPHLKHARSATALSAPPSAALAGLPLCCCCIRAFITLSPVAARCVTWTANGLKDSGSPFRTTATSSPSLSVSPAFLNAVFAVSADHILSHTFTV